MLDTIKNSIRINNNSFDDEILLLIESCKLDLKTSGVAPSLIKEESSLIKQAIILYCKANFGFDNQEADRFNRSYDLLKSNLSLVSESLLVEVTIESESD